MIISIDIDKTKKSFLKIEYNTKKYSQKERIQFNRTNLSE